MKGYMSYVCVCVCFLCVCVQQCNSVCNLICFCLQHFLTLSLSLSCLSVGLVYPVVQRTNLFSDCLECLPYTVNTVNSCFSVFKLTFCNERRNIVPSKEAQNHFHRLFH